LDEVGFPWQPGGIQTEPAIGRFFTLENLALCKFFCADTKFSCHQLLSVKLIEEEVEFSTATAVPTCSKLSLQETQRAFWA
jgi:hypothetical protein